MDNKLVELLVYHFLEVEVEEEQMEGLVYHVGLTVDQVGLVVDQAALVEDQGGLAVEEMVEQVVLVV